MSSAYGLSSDVGIYILFVLFLCVLKYRRALELLLMDGSYILMFISYLLVQHVYKNKL